MDFIEKIAFCFIFIFLISSVVIFFYIGSHGLFVLAICAVAFAVSFFVEWILNLITKEDLNVYTINDETNLRNKKN
jgi:hypothetical protein